MLDLLPGYEHDIEPGAGLAVGPGTDKVVIHTTESPRGSFNGIRNSWRGPSQWGKGLSTFLADGGRVVQLLPLSANAYTLENKAGGVDTNRAGHVIQVEWCRYSNDPWQDDEIQALGKWLADLKKAGLNFDVNNCPRFYGPNEGIVLASYGSPVRLQGDGWTNFNGWCGHQHAPENAHWDPGYLDTAKVVNIANSYLTSSAPLEEIDMAAKDEIIQSNLNIQNNLVNVMRNELLVEIVKARDTVIQSNLNIQSNLAGLLADVAAKAAAGVPVNVDALAAEFAGRLTRKPV